ncbi:glycerophosphodiester phosphodiesterase [Vibrio nitrifigilis]|uniref:glycerophosphodiester phosphodiesterase n=1 Tax=Vibrio nitrifigilis TaxID=2789781 RepID=UPI001E2F0556|nr:glycerophosphodiester phosphodiesterase [Vibrio nitrifigilis]
MLINDKKPQYLWKFLALTILTIVPLSTVWAFDIPEHAIIAHRGDSYDAPESTLPAYKLACEIGADYLELDLQRTKDGKLIALHDNNLKRTTNIEKVFPKRANEPVSHFTWQELQRLDAGSWFNHRYPTRARSSFKGLSIVTLKQVSDIAHACSHPVGLYIETKVPKLFPGIEKDLANFLKREHWLDKKHDGKIILQTFEKPSLVALQKVMPDVPKILLLWTGDGYIDAAPGQKKAADESYADYYAHVKVASKQAFEKWLDFAKEHGAIGVGPSTVQTHHQGRFSSQFSYMDLAEPWMVKMSHAKGLLVHAYTVDQKVDFERYVKSGVDGFFTNRTELAAQVLRNKPAVDIDAELTSLGY